MDGIVNLNKPSGITSYDAIRSLKKIFQEKKMGHLGTLDPMASGVLPIFMGKLTKLIPYFNGEDKGYLAEVTLGAKSTTLDKEGELTPAPVPAMVNAQQVSKVLQSFVGEIEQIPPMYSAIRQNGKRLYELAREGKEVERQPRQVTIYQITDIVVNLPQVCFEVHCSKGTYIRSLAADLGQQLGTEAYLSGLTRHLVGGDFKLADSIHLDQIEKVDHARLLQAFSDPVSLLSGWNQMVVAEREMEAILHGNQIMVQPSWLVDLKPDQSRCFVQDCKQRLIAVGSLEFSQEKPLFFQPKKVLV